MSLLIAFAEEKKNSAGQDYVIARLRDLGMEVLQDIARPHHVQVNCNDMTLLEREADRLHILKHNSKGFLQEFEIGLPRSDFKPCDAKTGALFTVSQCNFLLLSLIEQLTTDETFVRDIQSHETSSGGGETETEAVGVELLETCCTLGLIESYFPPHTSDPARRQLLFRRVLCSWRCSREGEWLPCMLTLCALTEVVFTDVL